MMVSEDTESIEIPIGSIYFPGLNVNVAFMNHQLTYEYLMIMSLCDSKRFKYKSFSKIIMSRGKATTIRNVMDLEQMYHAWCSIPFMGIIYSIMPTHHDDVEVIVYICMHALP